MRLDLVNFRGTVPTGAGTSLLSDWRVGTILQAVAIRDLKSGQLWLELGGQRHPARVASGQLEGPENGERLQVRVLRTHPVLALETLTSNATADDTQVTADALRRFVPKQESPTLMLANLAWLAQGKGGAGGLPKSVLDAAARLWQSLPGADDLSDPNALKATLNRSGIFLESNLASGQPASGQDLKALMLSLSKALQDSGARAAAANSHTAGYAAPPTARGALTNLPPAPATFALIDAASQQLNELARQTEGAVARLTTVQLANNADPSAPSFLIEVPVKHEDRTSMLRLRIEQEEGRREQSGSAGNAWTVEAALDLGVAGALHARVTLSDHRIGVQLRAESPAIVEALSARSGELESLLRESGLEIDRVVCLHGMPVSDGGPRPARLLDVRA